MKCANLSRHLRFPVGRSTVAVFGLRFCKTTTILLVVVSVDTEAEVKRCANVCSPTTFRSTIVECTECLLDSNPCSYRLHARSLVRTDALDNIYSRIFISFVVAVVGYLLWQHRCTKHWYFGTPATQLHYRFCNCSDIFTFVVGNVILSQHNCKACMRLNIYLYICSSRYPVPFVFASICICTHLCKISFCANFAKSN